MDQFFKIMKIAVTVAMTLAVPVSMLGIPLFLLYLLIAPLFGPDPEGHLVSVAKGTAWFVAICGVFSLGVMVAGWLYERFRVARLVLHGLGYALLGLIVLGGLLQCMDGHVSCTPSRYIDC